MIWTSLHKKAWTSIYHFVRLISHPTGNITMHCRHLVFVGKAFRVICSSNRALHMQQVRDSSSSSWNRKKDMWKTSYIRHFSMPLHKCKSIQTIHRAYMYIVHTTGHIQCIIHHTCFIYLYILILYLDF